MYLSKYILVCLLSCGFEYTGTLFIFALLLVLVHSLATAFFQTQMVSVFLFLSLTHYTWQKANKLQKANPFSQLENCCNFSEILILSYM